MKFTDYEDYAGVYCITCEKNNKVYIGCSNCIIYRWGTHIKELTKNNHVNRELQRDFNRYGIENFRFEVLETCLEDEIYEYETYYINQMLENDMYLYNEKKTCYYTGKHNVRPSAYDNDIWVYSEEFYADYEER